MPAAPPTASPHPQGPDTDLWRTSARPIAWIAGLFCALVAGLLVVSYLRGRAADPIDHPELTRLKAELVKVPADEALKQKIRTLDLELRRVYDAHLRRVALSAWLLFGGALVLLPALHIVTHRKKLPRPGRYVFKPELAERDAVHSRWAIAAAAVAVGGAVLLVAQRTRTSLQPVSANVSATNAETLTAAAALPGLPSFDDFLKQWPRFRGPRGDGVSIYTNLPSTWNTQTGQGVLWKSALPLSAPSSPIVWSNRVFLTGADAQKREVYCLDAATGKLLWQRPVGAVHAGVKEMEGANPASATPTTDGRMVFALFGTGEVAAFDFEGNPVWTRQLGQPENQYGHASSPIVHRDKLIVQYDQGEAEANKSKVLALDGASGKTVWESAPRPVPNSWSTPLVIQAAGREQLITTGNPWLIAYDPASGREWWRAKVLSGEVTPSATFGAGFVFASIDTEKLSAVHPDGTGEVTTNKVAWQADEGMPDIVSPLCDGQRVYQVTGSGLITCFDARTGKKLWEKELEQEVQASPSVAGDRLYFFAKSGLTVVLQAAEQLKELARCEMGEEVQASPAFSDGRLYVRGSTNLFCLGAK